MVSFPKLRYHFGWIVAGLAALLGAAAGLGWWAGLGAGPGTEALRAYDQGDWDWSVRLARRRLKEVPDDREAARLIARSVARQDRDRAAIAAYARIEPGWMTAEDHFLLGRAQARTGQDDLALVSLEAAQAADPDRLEILEELAQVNYRKDRLVSAEAMAEKLSHVPGREARALLMLGTFRSARHDPEGAASAFQRAFELDPEGKSAAPLPLQPIRMLWVRSWLQAGKPTEARLALGTMPAVEADPESAWLLSRCFLQEKAWTQAAETLRMAGSYRRDHPLEPEPAPYLGASRCADCHPSEYQSSLTSRHSTTFALAREARSFPVPDRPVSDPGDPAVRHRFERRGDAIRVETEVGNQVFRAIARYAFGSPDHFVTLTGSAERGGARMLRMSYYHSPRGSGWDLSTGLAARPAHPDQFVGEPMDPGDGERRCLACHTTNFRAIEDQVGPESADPAIGCERCHGPGGHHVLAVEAGLSDLAIVNPGRFSADAINRSCGECHGLTEPRGAVGDPDDPAWFRFQGARLLKSRCYSASDGRIHCVTCHDPHKRLETESRPYEAQCLSCHGAGKTTCPVEPVKGCVGCHMPKVWRKSAHSIHTDHRIRIISPPAAGS